MVKSFKIKDHLIDLVETFNNLRKHNMRLNLAKCVFGVEFGKFLGFMVSRKGIEVNPEKIKAIEEMKPPKSIKDVQCLTGWVTVLHRFISKSVDKCLSFFKILRFVAQKDEAGKPKKFAWTSKCQAAFNELKAYLSLPPLLTKAEEGEILYLYLEIFDTVVNSVLSALLVKRVSTLKLSSGPFMLTGHLATRGQFYNDSQLVVNQVNSTCKVTDLTLVKYLAMVSELKCHFERFQLTKVPRVENAHVMEINVGPETPSWTNPIKAYLRDGIIPNDKQEEMKLRRKAS
ncbi:hypothetical protein SLEP1_g18217 [Rubroshorea leprosula]|uniref:Reverse transcriptase domain-containing protein n=1 Tax=Rubroshorea leprosula TaxID=152421 RepID=A0AAV5J5V4_9ROSI|nr:hypothetical protein SLEP1_g18217 [Rubroshorea leprosula]